MPAQRNRIQAASLPSIAIRSLRAPVGVLEVAAGGGSLLYVGLARHHGDVRFDRWLRSRFIQRSTSAALESAALQLKQYFAGERQVFDIRLDPGGTDFQRKVWNAILAIPFGETLSYGELARQVGGSARAVGGAVGANPIAIVIPCHRVIGADGSLTGYGGGLRMKVWLLRHEGALLT